MIPSIITLSKSGLSTMGIDQPEGGTTGDWYLLFRDDSSTTSSYEIRYRERTRLVTSDSIGEWGSYTTYTETIALTNESGYVGVRKSLHEFAYTTLTNSTYDYLELELQVRQTGGTWSPAKIASVRLKPTITVAFSQTATDTYSLAITGDWTRNNNRIGIQHIKAGTTTLLSGWKYISNVPADGAVSIPSDWFSTIPARGQSIVIKGEYWTSDGARVAFSLTTSVTWTYCNTPVIALNPDDANGQLGITVTDAGDKSQPITSCTVSLVGGYSMPVTIGVEAYYTVPPLDVDVTVVAQAMSASGAMAQASETSKVNSNGKCWYNFGEDSLAMIYNRERNIDIQGKREYFEVDSGLKKVFFGGSISKTLTEKGAFLTDATIDDLEALSEYAGEVIYRVPKGEVRIVSIDSIALSQASDKYFTAIIQMTEVQ